MDFPDDGVCDLGIEGENVLVETQTERKAQNLYSQFDKLATLDFGYCRLVLAWQKNSVHFRLAGLRINALLRPTLNFYNNTYLKQTLAQSKLISKKPA